VDSPQDHGRGIKRLRRKIETMKRLLTGLALVAVLIAVPAKFTLAAGPTYLASFSGTITADRTLGTREFSGTYLLGAQIPIQRGRSIFVAYRSIRFGAENTPKSLQFGVVDYYDLSPLMEDLRLGIWLSSDVEVSVPEGTNPEMNGLFGWSLEKPIGGSGLLKGEFYNTWTVKDGADYITWGFLFKVTPNVPSLNLRSFGKSMVPFL